MSASVRRKGHGLADARWKSNTSGDFATGSPTSPMALSASPGIARVSSLPSHRGSRAGQIPLPDTGNKPAWNCGPGKLRSQLSPHWNTAASAASSPLTRPLSARERSAVASKAKRERSPPESAAHGSSSPVSRFSSRTQSASTTQASPASGSRLEQHTHSSRSKQQAVVSTAVRSKKAKTVKHHGTPQYPDQSALESRNDKDITAMDTTPSMQNTSGVTDRDSSGFMSSSSRGVRRQRSRSVSGGAGADGAADQSFTSIAGGDSRAGHKGSSPVATPHSSSSRGRPAKEPTIQQWNFLKKGDGSGGGGGGINKVLFPTEESAQGLSPIARSSSLQRQQQKSKSSQHVRSSLRSISGVRGGGGRTSQTMDPHSNLPPWLKEIIRRECRNLTRTKGVTVTDGGTTTILNPFSKNHDDLISSLSSEHGLYKEQLSQVAHIAPLTLEFLRMLAESNQDAKASAQAESDLSKPKIRLPTLSQMGRHSSPRPSPPPHHKASQPSTSTTDRGSKHITPKDLVVVTCLGTLMFCRSQRSSNSASVATCLMVDKNAASSHYDNNNKLCLCLSTDQKSKLMAEITRVAEARAKRLTLVSPGALSCTLDNVNMEFKHLVGQSDRFDGTAGFAHEDRYQFDSADNSKPTMTREELAERHQELFLVDNDDVGVMRHHTVTAALKCYEQYFVHMPDALRIALKIRVAEREEKELVLSKSAGVLPAHLRPEKAPEPLCDRDTLISLKMVNSNEGTTTGAVDAVRDLLLQMGVNDDNMRDNRVMFNGDLGTIKNILGGQDLVSGYFGGRQPPKPARDLLCILHRQGFFHTGWNVFRGLSRTHWGEKDIDVGSLRFYANLLSRFTKLKDAPIYDKFLRLLKDISSGAMVASLLTALRIGGATFPDVHSQWDTEKEFTIEFLVQVAEKFVDSLPVGMAANEQDAADSYLLFFPEDLSTNSIATRALIEQIHAVFYFMDCIKIKDDYGIFRYIKFSMPFFLGCGGAGYAGEMARYIASVVADTSEKDSLRLFFNSVGNLTGKKDGHTPWDLLMEHRIGPLKSQIGAGHNATTQSLCIASVTCPETHSIAKMHAKEVQAVYNPTSHTDPDASVSVSKVAEAIIQHGLLEGEEAGSGRRRWYKDQLGRGWDVINRGYILNQLETMPFPFYKPFAGGDVRPVVMKGGTGWPVETGVGRRVGAATTHGLDEAMALLYVEDELVGTRAGDAIYEDGGDGSH